MSIGRRMKGFTSAAALSLSFAVASPALAHDPGHHDAPRPSWKHDHHSAGMIDPQARKAWLEECRRRISSRDRGLGGAVIGGMIGGVAGNRIAGHGDRTVGTIAGAAVGAAAGMTIDKGEDRSRLRDECEGYLDDYYAYYSHASAFHAQAYRGYAYPHHYGYAAHCCQPQPAMMAPVTRQRAQEPECTETVEYEYEDVPAAPRPAPQKRVKIVPDKRIPIK